MTEDRKNKVLLWSAIIVCVIAFQFWDSLKESVGVFLSNNYGYSINFYHTGMALFYCLLAVFIFKNFKKYFASFVLLCLTINNLMDELIFNPEKIQLNEYSIILFLAIYWAYHYHKHSKK